MKKMLLNSKPEILDRLAKLTLASPRQFGKMSVHQAVCHMTDAYRLPIGELPSLGRGNLLQRTALKYLVLHVMTNWPPGAKTLPEYDQVLKETPPPQAFEVDKAELRSYVERVAELSSGHPFPTHPIFGVMSHEEWMRWGYQHANHHLRQFGV